MPDNSDKTRKPGEELPEEVRTEGAEGGPDESTEVAVGELASLQAVQGQVPPESEEEDEETGASTTMLTAEQIAAALAGRGGGEEAQPEGGAAQEEAQEEAAEEEAAEEEEAGGSTTMLTAEQIAAALASQSAAPAPEPEEEEAEEAEGFAAPEGEGAGKTVLLDLASQIGDEIDEDEIARALDSGDFARVVEGETKRLVSADYEHLASGEFQPLPTGEEAAVASEEPEPVADKTVVLGEEEEPEVVDDLAIEATTAIETEIEPADQATVALDTGAEPADLATVALDTGVEAADQATTMLDMGDEDDDDDLETKIVAIGEVADETVMIEGDEYKPVKVTAETEQAAPDHRKTARLAAEALLPRVGRKVAGRYEVVRKIGEGGFAIVYEAEDTVASGKVAIKVLKPDQAGVDDTMKDRFLQEVKLVRQLRHPNTIKISDAGETKTGLLFMAMEYLTGKPLDEYMDKAGQLEPARVVKITEQMLKSLAEAHEMGIVHRDLKPGNIMIGEVGGEEDFVKVLDFGIAKALGPEMGNVKTKTGLVCCTPKYASPEILIGRNIAPGSDVYAVGLMMIEMLIGKHVIATATDAEIIAYMLSPEPVSIPKSVEGTELGGIIEKATAKEIEERYQSAGEMLEALRQIDRRALPTAPLLLSDADTVILDGKYDSTVTASLPSKPVDRTRPMGTVVMARRKRRMGPVYALMAAVLLGMLALVWLTRPGQEPAEGTPDELAARTGPAADERDEEAARTEEERRRRSQTSARALLEARLAASDYEAGSWLDEVEGEPEGRPSREDQETADTAEVETVEGTGEGPAIAAVEETAGTGQGISPDLFTAILPIDEIGESAEGTGAASTEPELTEEERRAIEEADQAERLALLYESAQRSQDALSLLRAAVDTGQISDEYRANAQWELLNQTASLVGIMLELDDCNAAERRIDQAVNSEIGLPPDSDRQVAALRRGVESCQDRVVAARPMWDPREYRRLVREGQSFHAQALEMMEVDPEYARDLIYRSIHSRREAIAMLEGALDAGLIREANREDARLDLADLNQRLLASMLDLDLTVAAEDQAVETVEASSTVLSADEIAQLQDVQEQVVFEKEEEDAELEEEMIAAAQPEVAPIEAGTGAAGTGEAVAAVEGTEVEAGTGGTEAAPGAQGWDWNRYQSLVGEGQALLEEALIPEEPVEGTGMGAVAEAPAEETFNPWAVFQFDTTESDYVSGIPEGTGAAAEGTGLAALEGTGLAALEGTGLAAAEGTGLAAAEGTGLGVPGEGLAALAEELGGPDEEATAPTFTITLNIRSDPPRTRVYVDGDYIGRTPYEGSYSSNQEEAVVTLRKTNYETERITVQLAEGDFERDVQLTPSNPFGHTERLGGRR